MPIAENKIGNEAWKAHLSFFASNRRLDSPHFLIETKVSLLNRMEGAEDNYLIETFHNFSL